MYTIKDQCSAELLKAIRNAETEDLEFTKEGPMPGHSLTEEILTGYILARVAGVPVPKRGFISYVQNDSPKGRRYYVINWLHCEKIKEGSRPWPDHYCGPSEDEAKQDILRELRLLLE